MRGAWLSAETRPAITDTRLWSLCVLRVSGHSNWKGGDTCGLKSDSARQEDEAVSNNSNRQRRDRSCKNSQESGHARKAVPADLNQKKEQCSDVNEGADTRCGSSGFWLRTDAGEPQHINVMM